MKELERDLGLFSVFAVSIGAMIGSGIFILPALAVNIAGPSVVAAYLLAGLLVVPAALSKSEMATAMPEAGGTYVFIERAMGPLFGTVAGIGTWFSLAFKSGLALVGGVPYLLLFFDVPQGTVTPIALGLAVLLVVVNLLGAKQTGRLQVVIVSLMLAALAWFVVGGVPSVETARYDPFFTGGAGGLLAATGLVFVSYAGVTKVASVAEEVENPGRNIPLGILGSLAFTTLLYVLIVVVMLGVVDAGAIAGSLTPMSVVAEATLGSAGALAVALAAILALVSTANAGILSSSRYPFAMSRDRLVPQSLGAVSDRFKTPSASITLTGVVLLVLIAFVPIQDIAKLASAFQILVFVLVNVALIAFRESGSVDYVPDFRSPLYPWMQLAGASGGVLLLTQMGTVPLAGAAVIAAAGVAWYYLYARRRVSRSGVAVETARTHVSEGAVEATRDVLAADDREHETLVVARSIDDLDAGLLRTGAAVAHRNGGRLTVARVDEVKDQMPLEAAAETRSPADERFESHVARTLDAVAPEVDFETGEVVSHDPKHAVVNAAASHSADLLVVPGRPGGRLARLRGDDAEWISRHAPCDTAFVDGRIPDDLAEVRVVTTHGPYDPGKLAVADALAVAAGAGVHLRYAISSGDADDHSHVDEYHQSLLSLCDAPVRAGIVRTDGGTIDEVSATGVDLSDAGRADASDALVYVTGPSAPRLDVDAATITVVPHRERRPGRLRGVVERVLF